MDVCHVRRRFSELFRIRRWFVRTGTVFVFLLILLCWILVVFNKASSNRSDDSPMPKHGARVISAKHVDKPSNASSENAPLSAIEDSNKTKTYQNESLKPERTEATTVTGVIDKCTFPILDPFEPAVIALSTFNPPINCEKGVSHLVYMSGYTVKVNHSRTAAYANKTYPFKECRYKSIIKEPGSDFNTVVIYTSESFKDEITPRDIDDNLIVECINTNNTAISRSYFTLIRVKFDLELELETKYQKHLAINSPKEVLNVLMVGLDGNSKQNLERHMPKTRNFLLNELKALELHKYNKVGDNTHSNLCPLLAGKTYKELERNNWRFADHLDFVNEEFLWSEFRRVGYRTGVFFDDSVDTAFHFYRKGWDKPPADYYMRATINERCKDSLMTSKTFDCVGDIPEITSNCDFWIQMASTFNSSKTKPYFGFSFSSHLTHDDHNRASAGDHLYLQFFQELRDKNLINNTVIVFFSDHGERFGKVRSTYNGMLESKMPHVFLVFPPWFYQKYPELTKVLKINQDRLTTNRDVYETIRDLVDFQATTGKGDLNKRGISLFYEIPRERTCEHAEIPMEYCACHQMTAENIPLFTVLLLSEGVKYRLRELIKSHTDKCEWLHLKSTKRIMKIQSDAGLQVGKPEDMSMYQLTIVTYPGGGIYESTMKFWNSNKTAEVVGDIMRLNMYRGQVECIDDLKVQPFCFCKK